MNILLWCVLLAISFGKMWFILEYIRKTHHRTSKSFETLSSYVIGSTVFEAFLISFAV